MATATAQIELLTAEELLKYWQGHRRLTRKTIEAFPEDKLFQFSVGGMRTFSDLVWEFVGMIIPIVDGVATGEWKRYEGAMPTSKSGLLKVWDDNTAALDEKFLQIPAHRFSEFDKAFGQWHATGLQTIQYAIDNEIHHRGQGYVYLRALGIQPPHFWERD